MKKILYALGRLIFRVCFRTEIRGMENYYAAGARVLILPNHTSLLDAALVALFLPREPVFAINLYVARLWGWLRPFLRLIRTWAIDPGSPFALKGLIAEMKGEGHCVFFPEGRISTTGGLMKIYDGAALLADKTDAVLLPLRIDGALFSKVSYMRGKYPQRWFPKITLTFLPPRRADIPQEIRGRRRRECVRLFLYSLMRDAAFASADGRRTLFESLLEARRLYGRRRVIAMDVSRKPVRYDDMITAAVVLGERFEGSTQTGERVGLMLPGSVAAVALAMGLSRLGRVPAMLNYTAGARSILSCCRAACVGTVVTSRKFVEAGKLAALIEALEAGGLRIAWLEDEAASAGRAEKFAAWRRARRMKPRDAAGDPDAPALVLFTSGSEGAPKGVVLSHANIVSNRNQLIASIDFNPGDVVMNAMPMFHVFGFVVGTLMPLLTGIRSFYYPTPLHYRMIPLVAYDIDATVLFGTDTFLYAYARAAHPYDFYRVRYAFAGAEKLRERTRRIWGEKFGIRVIEGYGTTETSIVSANTPLQFRVGTVGRAFPGMQCRLEPVPGIEEGGRLFIRGPNVMLGYMRADDPGTIRPPEGDWYDTGDIVAFDEHGFMTIMGRAKRFAKVGGEMVSLVALEEEIDRLWPGVPAAVVATEDERRGETLVLVTEKPDARREELAAHLKGAGYPEVAIPKKILCVEKIPLLGSGKTDYPAVERLVA